MKLRIRGNSIRFRLRKNEVHQLAAEGEIVESISFGESQLKYAIKTGSTSTITAAFENNRIDVSVPLNFAVAWETNDEIGISHVQPNENGEPLKILIEKDFECVDGASDESQDDAYPNPLNDSACAPRVSV